MEIAIAMEESPIGDNQANGAAENAGKNAQGQFLALTNALESRINKRAPATCRLARSIARDPGTSILAARTHT